MRRRSIFSKLSAIYFYGTASAYTSVQRPSRVQVSSVAARAMSSASNEAECGTLRILALHGKGGDGPDFSNRLSSYIDQLQEQYSTTLDVVSIDAPFPIEGGGFAWWTLPPYSRSFNATEYKGFDKSSNLVMETLKTQGPFDYVYGHSQGAILTAALLGTCQFTDYSPRKGFILNGVAWPNPFSEQLRSLKYASDETKPRVLFITGLQDNINPPDTQLEVQKALEKAGADITSVKHPGGHNIPMKRDDTLSTILEWMTAKV